MPEPGPAMTGPARPAAGDLLRRGFDVQTAAADGDVVLHLRGELDMATAADLHPVLFTAMAGARTVILDLAELAFVDSSGINLFLSAWRQATHEGRSVLARNPTSAVGKALRLSGVDRKLGLRPSAPDEGDAAPSSSATTGG